MPSLYAVRYIVIDPLYNLQLQIIIHLIHDSNRQQYWFDDTWRCMYSFVLLMMVGGTGWNM